MDPLFHVNPLDLSIMPIKPSEPPPGTPGGKPLTFRETLAARPSALHFTDAEARAVQAAFAEHPDWNGIYLFWTEKHDGSKIEPDSWANTMTSRLTGIVSMSTEGIPMHVSRTGFAKWKRDTDWKGE